MITSKELKIDFRNEIHDKNINLLIGSGASYGALPTLATKIKDKGENITSEDIITKLEKDGLKHHAYLYMYECLYNELILPAFTIDYSKGSVSDNYNELMRHLINLISIKKTGDIKRCNIFTSNYDGFFENAAEYYYMENSYDFIFNDGCRGFKNKVLSASNYNIQTNHLGIFDSYLREIPTVNLIKIHGSIYWEKDQDHIMVKYDKSDYNSIHPLSKKYLNKIKKYDDFAKIEIQKNDIDRLEVFWEEYQKIPIVNPTKWKFHETVFEEHYYQMLRLLSYELEKKNTCLIVFGFSFADEYICSLVKRSLLNPHLAVYIFCFSTDDYKRCNSKFSDYKNIIYFVMKSNSENLDFNIFNKIIAGDNKKATWKAIK